MKSGFVSIIGLPNAGKSTFLNAIVKDNIAITSRKAHTTRKNIKGIYNDKDSQIIFVDTPGILKVHNKLDEFMEASIKSSLDDVDCVIALIDVLSYSEDNFDAMKSILRKTKAKKILVQNKIDKLVDDIDIDLGIDFLKTFKISALKKKNIDEVIKYIKSILPEGERFYPEDDLTDEPTKQIVADIVRKYCLYKLDKEIPHGVTVVVNSMKMSNSKCMNIEADIICERDSHKGIIIGKSGSMIKNIGTGARIEIEKFLHNKVNLKLNVVVKENWRDEKTLVVNFGYDIKSL